MNLERARREIDALFPGLEQNEALQAAFHAHPDALKYRTHVPDLGLSIPWVLVTCVAGERQLSGIIVAGLCVRYGWDLRLPFTIFTTDLKPVGTFVAIDPVAWTAHVVGTMPGSVRHADRPDAVALLVQIAELSLAWARDLNLTRIWNRQFNRRGQREFPDCFIELHDNATITRGLVVGGELDPSGGWDFSRSVLLMTGPETVVALEPIRADWMEVLHEHDVAQPCRR